MKIALVGAGKTGSKVIELAETQSDIELMVFDSKNEPTAQKLKDFNTDVVLSFLPGDIFLELLPVFLESKINLVTGSTGFEWPQNIDQQLKDLSLTWVRSHNFALGMNLVKSLIEMMAKTTELFDDVQFSIHEVHHTGKKDAPSGTAISWQRWLGHETQMSSDRIGDVVGDHHLTADTPYEMISLTHKSKDRKIFAHGALWAAKYIYQNPQAFSGLTHFQELASKRLNEGSL